jgi:hypothetical protein
MGIHEAGGHQDWPSFRGRCTLAPMAQRRGYPSHNQLVRKKLPADIRSLCRSYTKECVRHLAAIMRQPEFPPAARVAAACALLDRGWGKAPQSHSGEKSEGLIVVEIVHRCREPEVIELPVIEHTPIASGHGRDPERR